MSGFEQTIVVGYVGKAPELRHTGSGAAVTGFSIAVDTTWKDKDTGEKKSKTTWYVCSCWGRLAEVAEKYVQKGSQIMVIGTVTARAWSDNDGEARASLDLRADNFQLLGGGEPREEREYAGNGAGGNGGDNVDDIPFDWEVYP